MHISMASGSVTTVQPISYSISSPTLASVGPFLVTSISGSQTSTAILPAALPSRPPSAQVPEKPTAAVMSFGVVSSEAPPPPMSSRSVANSMVQPVLSKSVLGRSKVRTPRALLANVAPQVPVGSPTRLAYTTGVTPGLLACSSLKFAQGIASPLFAHVKANWTWSVVTVRSPPAFGFSVQTIESGRST